MTGPQHLAVIPARGGSRGIPRKNLELVGGQPLVARTVRAALASGVFAAIVVSTDDDEIAAVARACGAHVVIRPADLARDASPTEPVMQHALVDAESSLGMVFGSVWLLQATSPFLRAADISRARALLESGSCDAVIAVHEAHSFSWSEGSVPGLVEPSYNPASRPRRQDMAAFYQENGALYAVSRATWDEYGVRIGGRVAPLPMSAWRSLDIDSSDDLAAARALALPAADIPPATMEELSRIGAVALDFDGVLTDNRVVVNENGEESVTCSRGDGLALSRLKGAGIHAAVFSTERNPVVGHRCRKLDLPCFQGLDQKPPAISSWLATIGVPSARCAYVGNDVNDLAAMELVGLPVALRDGHPLALAAAKLVLTRPGGHGAVAELVELLLQSG